MASKKPKTNLIAADHLKELETIFEIMRRHDVKKLVYKTAEADIMIKRFSSAVDELRIPDKTPAAVKTPSKVNGIDSVIDPGTTTIYSPMVGTFYRAASPTSLPFVDLQQTIKVGQRLCIVEAMKLMNPIEAEVSGVVVHIYPSNGDPVEFGQPLFEIQTLK